MRSEGTGALEFSVEFWLPQDPHPVGLARLWNSQWDLEVRLGGGTVSNGGWEQLS